MSRWGSAAVFDVQLVKFWRLVSTREDPGPLDVDNEEVVLAFERKAGRLVYISTASGPLVTETGPYAPDRPSHDWENWLLDHEPQARDAMRLLDQHGHPIPKPSNDTAPPPKGLRFDGLLGGSSDEG